MMYGFGWQAAMGGIVMIAFWGLIIWAIVSAVRPNRTTVTEHGALDVLDDRFARGEIDGEELRSRKAILKGGI